MVHWDVGCVTPAPLKKVQIAEDPNFGFASCVSTLGFQSSDARNLNHAFIGTTTGNLYFYSLTDRALMRHSVKRQ